MSTLPDPVEQHCSRCAHKDKRPGAWCWMFNKKPLYMCVAPIFKPKEINTGQ